MKWNRRFENEEPMSCERQECTEDMNGLNHFWIEMGDGFAPDIWLCDDCAKKFGMKITIVD